MECQKCHAQLEEATVFCHQCGTKVGDTVQNEVVDNISGEGEQVVNETVESIEATARLEEIQPMPEPVVSQPQMTPQPQVAPQPQMTPQPQVAPQPQMAPPSAPMMGGQPQPAPAYYAGGPPVELRDQPMTVLGWLGTMLIMAIPIVNIVMFFVWILSSNTNKSKRSYFIASLIIFVVMMVLSIVFWAALSAILLPLLDNMDFETINY